MLVIGFISWDLCLDNQSTVMFKQHKKEYANLNKGLKKTPMDKAYETKSYSSVCRRSRLFGSPQNWSCMGDQRVFPRCSYNQPSCQEIKSFWMGSTTSGVAWFYSLAKGQHRGISCFVNLSDTPSEGMENFPLCRRRQLAQRPSCQTISQRTCKSYIGVSSAISSRTKSTGKDMAYDSLRSNYEQILCFGRCNPTINSSATAPLEAK